MKKYIYLLLLLCSLTACGGSYEECPEITKGYANDFIMPAPTVLTVAEKEYVEELRKEYNESLAEE